MSKGEQALSRVPWGSVLCPGLFNILINDLEDVIECTVRNLQVWRMGGVSDILDSMIRIQNNVDKLKNGPKLIE